MIDLIPGINSTASALNAERMRMDVIGQNIANINVSRGLDGKPYQRQVVRFESVLQQRLGGASGLPLSSVRVAQIQTDGRPPKTVLMRGHPNADANGYVSLPDISIHEEMVDYIAASRSFEANLSVIKNARAMALAELSIGRR